MKLVVSLCLVAMAAASYEDFEECFFKTCPENIMLFPYNKTNADACGGTAEDYAMAIKYSKGNFDGPGNRTVEEIGEAACKYMGTWKNKTSSDPQFACMPKSCADKDQIESHFVISSFEHQDCLDYQRDQIEPPADYAYDDYGDGDGDGDEHASEVEVENADGAMSHKTFSTSAIVGVACITAGVAALVLAALVVVRGRKTQEIATLKPNMEVI